jgi:two-component system response regulator VicR
MKTILICEDEKFAQESIKNIFVKRNFTVHTAGDGEESIEKAKETKPDVILLDIRMPKLDGIEVAKEIRKFDSKAKLIFITGFQSQELSKEASKYDISDYIVKPTTPQDIIQAVEAALAS